ncbi:portal protein [Acinetobacter phage vB_AbaS_Silvergun]
MSRFAQFRDGLLNVVANLGTGRDKAASTHVVQTFKTDYELLTAYRELWMAKKIVNIPARDAVREWRSWQASSEQITKLERVEAKYGLRLKIEDALRKARLFGGAAIYIGTYDSDPSKPMMENSRLRYLTVMPRAKLTAKELVDDIRSPYYGQPEYFTVANTQEEIHASRLVIFVGQVIPDDIIANVGYLGWGDSVLASCLAAVMRAESSYANANSLIYEARVDVLSIPNLTEEVQTKEGEERVTNLARVAATSKGNNGMMMIDKEMDYDSKSASFGGLNELMEKFIQEGAGAADIPATRLLGMSPSGLNSTGESDLRNYYDSIRSMQTLDIGPAMAWLDELLIREALGGRPTEVHYNWNVLWQPTAKEMADIGKTTADTLKTLVDTALFNGDALSVAGANLLTERGVVPGLENALNKVMTDPDSEDDPTSNPANNE